MAWVCNATLAAVDARRPPCDSWLTSTERLRLHGFARPSRQQQYLAGRWLLRELLGALLDREPATLAIELDARMRSQCLAQGWQLSLSHCAELLAAAAAPIGPALGIDLEAVKPGRDWAALAAHFELPAGSSERDFYRHWTLGEAWLKASPTDLGLLAAQRLRWKRQPLGLGPAWCAQAGPMHLALVAARTPQWWRLPAESPAAWNDDGCWGPA
ncbi:MAG: hypothetical protein U1E77_03590 [Inhella sp.]